MRLNIEVLFLAVEMLFAVMGAGCKTVQAIHTADADVATGHGKMAVFAPSGVHVLLTDSEMLC
jgi:hypothetical protein